MTFLIVLQAAVDKVDNGGQKHVDVFHFPPCRVEFSWSWAGGRVKHCMIWPYCDSEPVVLLLIRHKWWTKPSMLLGRTISCRKWWSEQLLLVRRKWRIRRCFSNQSSFSTWQSWVDSDQGLFFISGDSRQDFSLYLSDCLSLVIPLHLVDESGFWFKTLRSVYDVRILIKLIKLEVASSTPLSVDTWCISNH